MDPDGNSQPTQQATQNVLDPRRLGKQNSGFSDEDIADIICLLIPFSENARVALGRIAAHNSAHLARHDDAARVDLDFDFEDDAQHFQLMPSDAGEHAVVLRLSARVKNPLQGFTFGRNIARCDICFAEDPHRRLSNIHFRIYLNEYGVLMLEDQSTNGTVVDDNLLKAKSRNPGETKRTLNSGSKIAVLMHTRDADLSFLVRIPRREGEYEAAYRRNLVEYMKRQEAAVDAAATIVPGPGGRVDLFPEPAPDQRARLFPQHPPLERERTQENTARLERFPKPWTGSGKYNRVGEIGKGAFATVYKVTTTFGGIPFAAKELDKRKFMKNGILDQKVENEMKIMQKVHHPNIVRYVDHIDWENRLLIIIMEYVQGGDLGRLILDNGPLSEEATRIMARQLLGALGHLHDNHITHRDVKPDNILIGSHEPFVVKLTDFGLSKMIDNEQTFLRTFCGTLLYCAPEVYTEFAEYDEFGRRHPRNRQRRHNVGQRYDHAVDIWSLGGVLFYALTASPPYPVATGISYSELLHQIMTQPLDITPLIRAGISSNCIDFLRHMLDKKPETRATVDQLLRHPWLGGPGFGVSQSFDEISDDEEALEQGASQLSLDEKENRPIPQSDDEIIDDDEISFGADILSGYGYESEKENQTFGPRHHQRPRLFGEVNASALGSSGAIPVDRLNLPVAHDTSFGTTEILGDGSEVRDSFDSDASSTPQQQSSKPSQPIPGTSLLRISLISNHSQLLDPAAQPSFAPGSQSLGGTESIMGNLNMKSLGGSNLRLHEQEFNMSKRKPSSSDTEDEIDSSIPDRPNVKRLRSQGQAADTPPDDSSDDGGDYDLYANIPLIQRDQSGRQIDTPVPKSTWWQQDKTTWHLRYPEMTHLQYGAFKVAAEARGEEFSPGKSPLWNLAVKHFPPVQYDEALASKSKAEEAALREGKAPREENLAVGAAETPYPSTAASDSADVESIPDTQPPRTAFVVPIMAGPLGSWVANLQATEDSAVEGISVPITEPMVSWGRALDNTSTYPIKTEVQVPKYGFKIVLWKEWYDATRNPRPWNAGFEQDSIRSFYFYISTKATRGIYVNGTYLPSHDYKNPSSPCKFWLRLHHGDSIVVWQDDESLKTELLFSCSWGGSASPRSSDTREEGFVSEAVARILDDTCAQIDKKKRNQSKNGLKMEEADYDVTQRSLYVDRERDRSRTFELRIKDARRILAARASRKTSPVSVHRLVVSNRPLGGGMSLPFQSLPRVSPESGAESSPSKAA